MQSSIFWVVTPWNSTELHGVTTQKMVLFIVTGVRTSYLPVLLVKVCLSTSSPSLRVRTVFTFLFHLNEKILRYNCVMCWNFACHSTAKKILHSLNFLELSLSTEWLFTEVWSSVFHGRLSLRILLRYTLAYDPAKIKWWTVPKSTMI
jgi:hypothetical protein